MEGNPLFPEDQRIPTGQAILQARAKDDAELEMLANDVEAFFAEFQKLTEQGQVSGRAITDVMQHRVEPLMVRSAEIGHLPSAQRHLEALTGFMESMLDHLKMGSDAREGFRKDWRRRTNVFIAQQWRNDTPMGREDHVRALLCESVEQVKCVLDLYHDLNAEIGNCGHNAKFGACSLRDC